MFTKKRRGPYKKYIRAEDGSISYPRTTAWRNRRRVNSRTSILEQQSSLNAGQEATSSTSSHRPADTNHEEQALEEEEIMQDDALAEDDQPISDREVNVGEGCFFNEKLAEYMHNYGDFKNFHTNLSASEISFMLITLAISQNFTLSATWKLFKLMNIILGTTVFPDTKYKFQTLFNPGLTMEHHFTCQYCGHYLGKKSDTSTKQIVCLNCLTSNSVEGYKYEDSFITLDIKAQLKNLFDVGAIKLENVPPTATCNDILGGSMYRRMRQNFNSPSEPREIFLSCIFNADDAPVSKDGKTKITPLFLMINEASEYFRGKNLILAGLHYGKKPRMEVFLLPFVDIMTDICRLGLEIELNGEIFVIRLVVSGCCVDTVARSPIQGVVGVNGYYCCSWCHIKGDRNDEDGGPVKYIKKLPDGQEYEPEERMECSFLESCKRLNDNNYRDREDGIQIISPLINLPNFKMVWGFMPDYMHCVLLGITKRFLGLWFSSPGETYYIGNPSILKVVDDRIKNIRPPKICKRAPLLISKRAFMKARELENWFLFYSVPILKDLLPDDVYQHWLLLVGSMQTLLQDSMTEEEIDGVEVILEDFNRKTEDIYGSYEMTYNCHQLTHMASSARRWGPLWAHTAFPFEHSIGNLKRLLKCTKGIPHQIVRRLDLNNCMNFMSNFIGVDNEIVTNFCDNLQCQRVLKSFQTTRNEYLLGKPNLIKFNTPQFPNIEFTEYGKLVHGGIVYSNKKISEQKKFDNSFVALKDGSFGRINHIVVDDQSEAPSNDVYISLTKFFCDDFPPLKLTKKIVGRRNADELIKFNEVKSAAVYVMIKNGSLISEYITEVPRKHFLINM